MDIVTILALIVNINLNSILAFPQEASTIETNGQSSFAQEGSRNANSNTLYGYSYDEGTKGLSSHVEVAAQPQDFSLNDLHYGHGYPASDGLQEQKNPSAMIRTKRSYDQSRLFPGRPSPAEELTSLLLSRDFNKGQNLDTFFHLLSLLTANQPIDQYPETDFLEEDDLEAPIDLLHGRGPNSLPKSTHSYKGKESYRGDDAPMANMNNNRNYGRLKLPQKKHDLIPSAGRLYSLGQLLENSQNTDPSIPVYRRPII